MADLVALARTASKRPPVATARRSLITRGGSTAGQIGALGPGAIKRPIRLDTTGAALFQSNRKGGQSTHLMVAALPNRNGRANSDPVGFR